MKTKWQLLLALVLDVTACAASPGTRPDHNSLLGHEEAARQHEAAAQELVLHPTQDVIKQWKSHMKLAARHHAAAQQLQAAEEHACAGLSQAERQLSPFGAAADIEGVDTLYEGFALRSGGAPEVGAAVRLRPSARLTPQALQRRLECHLARHATLGYPMPHMADCPLMKGAIASVSTPAGGLAVAIRSEDRDTAAEIVRRAETLGGLRPQLAASSELTVYELTASR